MVKSAKKTIYERAKIDQQIIDYDDICICVKPKPYKFSVYNRIHKCTCGKHITENALKHFPIKTRYQFINENSIF